MQIGERIRQIRIHKGLTQGELVSGICSVAYLSRILKTNWIEIVFNLLFYISLHREFLCVLFLFLASN
ncbi:hypothetical protein COL91_20105 [Bacillus pseudomycoides]|nr:hypothetical protein COO02_24855 [Bacillus pseudomycoides]PEI81936.1 hypothetical protein CN679_28400 [Bacillus pseudomycoides]PGA88586.1 hypothetical protein COL91_20105 [Bacillus pseudomycoides]PHF46039.1 hypothetical protein COF72_13450 [Bacillus pseudomycoides]